MRCRISLHSTAFRSPDLSNSLCCRSFLSCNGMLSDSFSVMLLTSSSELLINGSIEGFSSTTVFDAGALYGLGVEGWVWGDALVRTTLVFWLFFEAERSAHPMKIAKRIPPIAAMKSMSTFFCNFVQIYALSRNVTNNFAKWRILKPTYPKREYPAVFSLKLMAAR